MKIFFKKQILKISNANNKVMEIKRKGSAWIEYLAIGAIAILIAYPLLSGTVTQVFTSIKTWFGTNIIKIFV